MTRRIITTIFSIIFTAGSTFAQINENIYRGTSNEQYWKNRMPDKAYWQQDVAYKINAMIHEDENRIEATEELAYWNNSPDTLYYVYYHLYQNAFIKGSYLHQLEDDNKTPAHLGHYEAAGLGITVENIRVNGIAAKSELDNTIMKVYLPIPLAPGGKITIQMGFNTYFDNGSTRRRMKMYDAWGFMHYNGCQWYPKISVYDRMHGWDTYQHLNREFYGDFGVFDVTLDMPSNYIVEASGELMNRSEMLPDTLRKKLDIKNFANASDVPSTIIPYVKGQRKQWRFLANNVHDFAFTADPSYRIGTSYWNGIECVAIVQEPHAAGWQNAPDYIANIIKTFSSDIGMYRYPKIVAADAQDGMEYPMITMDGGSDPGYRGLFIHEIGHNWFYGQVGNNETYRAAMDEGFTQFLTALGFAEIEGPTIKPDPKAKGYRNKFVEPLDVVDRNVLLSYTLAALNQNEIAINTHSDDFNNALNHGGGYGLVYYKTATMLYNLQYVLGDSLFKAAINHYFTQWRFAHPYFEDFRASVINFTHVDLSWFFDEWFETTKTVDYSVTHIHKIAGADSFAIKFRRRSDMQMPIDFTVTAKDGKKYSYYIPNTWFVKSTKATVLPKWFGYGKMTTTYTANVKVPGGIHSVQIDTTYRLGDRNYADNYKTRGLPISPEAIHLKFDGGRYTPTDRRKYRLSYRPDLWWNPIDGIKAGLHFDGDYMNTLYKTDATFWWNTHALQETNYQAKGGDGTYKYYRPFNYSINYITPVTRNFPKLQLQLNSRYLDGGWFQRGGFNWMMTDKNTVQLYVASMWRHDSYATNYLTDPADWNSTWAHPNTNINFAWSHTYNYEKGAGRYTFSYRAPFLNGNNSPFNYSYAQLESINTGYYKKFEVRTRMFGRFGMGNRAPSESMLYLAGASPEDMMENKYSRSIGTTPTEWDGVNRYDVTHFQQGGGLNLRGYTGYNSPDERSGMLLEGYKARSGVSANLEIGFDNYIPFKPRITRNWLKANLYAFADAGYTELSYYSIYNIPVVRSSVYWSNLHADAGLGAAFTIKSWGVFEKARPLTIRFDLPVFLNRPTYSNPQYLAFRYVVGINRAF